MIGAWVVAAIFFAVYDMAIDTIFFCFRKSSYSGGAGKTCDAIACIRTS